MSHSQFHKYKLFILTHAWLNLWNKHMTTGRINQISIGAVTNSLFDGVFRSAFHFWSCVVFFWFWKNQSEKHVPFRHTQCVRTGSVHPLTSYFRAEWSSKCDEYRVVRFLLNQVSAALDLIVAQRTRGSEERQRPAEDQDYFFASENRGEWEGER